MKNYSLEDLQKLIAELVEVLKDIRAERLAIGSPFWKKVTALIDKVEGKDKKHE